MPVDVDEVYNLLNSFYVKDGFGIRVVDADFDPSEEPNLDALLKRKKFKQSFINGIMQVNNCRFEWVDPKDEDIIGKAEILEMERLGKNPCNPEKGKDAPDELPLRSFYFVDSVQPEWQVGIFCGKHAGDSLYLLEGASCYYLGLNIEGYVKMLIATRGFNHWQYALWQYRTKEESVDSLDVMKENLPRLFPEVKMKEVFALYDSLYFEEEMPPGTE